MALSLAARPEPMQIVGIDIAEPYIAFATPRSTDPRLSFLTGDAVALDFPAGSFDRCFSVLALNFISDPARAVAGMRRVARSSGVVAAAVWDFAGGLVYQRIFWDTAAALDPVTASTDRWLRARTSAPSLRLTGRHAVCGRCKWSRNSQ